MNDEEVISRAELPSTVVRSLGVPTVNLDRALQLAGDLEDEEIAHAMGLRGARVGDEGGVRQ